MPDDQPPLPKGWIRTFSNSQKRFYYSHKDTKHTQWHFPTASEAADPWMAKRRCEENQQKEKHKRKGSGSSEKSGSNNSNKRPRTDSSSNDNNATKKKPPIPVDSLLALADTTNVAIIVPYRDLHAEQKRAAHLAKFVPHMTSFLSRLQHQLKKISGFHVYIVEQSDDGRKFNRGKLLNIGFDVARKTKRKHDVFVFHDVDLLPQQDLAEAYAAFPRAPYHIARVWDRYSNNPKYFGGVVSFSYGDFKRINGYPNTFWGWGGEDDELQLRCQALGLKWDWPSKGTLVDLEEMNLSEKLNFLREHKEWKCMVKWEALKEHETTWKTNGLADLQYKVLATKPLDGKPPAESRASLVSVDVKLNGNHWANDKCGVEFLGDWNKPK